MRNSQSLPAEGAASERLRKDVLAEGVKRRLDKASVHAPLAVSRLGLWGIPMKKTYEKPTLNKRQQLSRVTASPIPSAAT